MNYKGFTFFLGAALLASLPVFAASPYHYAVGRTNFNLVPGIEYAFTIRVLDQSNRVASNYFGRLTLSSPSPGISLDPSALDVIGGLTFSSVALKVIDDSTSSFFLINDTQASLSSLTNTVTATNPEQKWLPSPPSLVINEIMYATGLNLDEWIEFFNPTAATVGLNNYTIVISDGLAPTASYKYQISGSTRTVPPGTYTIPPGGFMLLVRDLSRFQLHYPDIYDAVLVQSGSFTGSIIVENPASSGNFDLGTTMETVFIRSNNSTNAPILSLVCYNGDWGGKDGFSLSRRDPSASALSPLNWSSSPGIGGTPCQENNTRVAYPPAKSILNLSTNIIDPDLSTLTITAEAKHDLQTASVDIVSTTGRSVRTLVKQDNLASGTLLELSFDGKDENGNVLPLGLYFVRFTGQTSKGDRTVSMKALVVAGGMR